MSTRAMYSFIDEHDTYHVYKHHDGYPDAINGAYAHIMAGLKFAWQLPRFEADEFAAAFVTANKIAGFEELAPEHRKYAGGGVRLMQSGDWKEVAPCDIDYRYEIRAVGNELHVKGFGVCWLGEGWLGEGRGNASWDEKALPDYVIKAE